MSKPKYKIQTDNLGSIVTFASNNRTVKVFDAATYEGDWMQAQSAAQDYVQSLVEADQWNAANRD